MNDVLKIDCSVFDGKIYFFIKDKNEASKNLINKLCQNNIFQRYNDYGVYTDYDNFKIKQGYGYQLLSLIKKIAEKQY